MTPLSFARPAGLVLVLTLAGCEPGTAPVAGGIYVLEQVDGRNLPAQPAVGGPTIHSGWITFPESPQARVTGVLEIARLLEPPGGNGELVRTEHQFAIDAGTISVEGCPVGSACLAIVPHGYTGVFAGDRLTLTFSMGPMTTVYRYRRSGPGSD